MPVDFREYFSTTAISAQAGMTVMGSLFFNQRSCHKSYLMAGVFYRRQGGGKKRLT
jgi:hypothetical protein